MAGPNFILDKGFFADSVLSQFRAVKLVPASPEHCTAVTGTGDQTLGIVQQNVVAADAGRQVVDVRILGISKMEASAAITAGGYVQLAADGRAAAWVAPAADTAKNIVGMAMTTSAGAGEWIDVYLYGPGAFTIG